MADGDLPKYLEAELAIRRRIEQGLFAPGDRIPSEADLAEEMRMSRMTVRHGIGRLVQGGVLERRAGVGTFVREQRTAAIGVLVFASERTRPGALLTSELEALQESARGARRTLHVINVFDPARPPERLLADLSSLGIGALGIIGFGLRHADLIRQVARNVPCVLINKALPGVPLPCAKPDLPQAARLTVAYFAARGRRRVGVLIRDATHPQQLEMLIQMEAELRRGGLDVDKRLWYEGGAGPREEVDRRMYAWVEATAHRRTPPDALAVFDVGEVVPRFEAVLARRGGRLGRTFDVVQQADAFGDLLAKYPWPAIVFDYAPVVRDAAALLLAACRRPEPKGNGAVKVSPVRLLVPEGFEPSGGRGGAGSLSERR